MRAEGERTHRKLNPRQTLGLTEDEVRKIEQAASPYLSGVLKATPPAPDTAK